MGFAIYFDTMRYTLRVRYAFATSPQARYVKSERNLYYIVPSIARYIVTECARLYRIRFANISSNRKKERIFRFSDLFSLSTFFLYNMIFALNGAF